MGPAVSLWISRVPSYSGCHFGRQHCRIWGFHLLWLNFPVDLTNVVGPFCVVLLPQYCRNSPGLGCSDFARHYFRNHFCFLFLRVLRCFSSPGWLLACARCLVFYQTGCPIQRSWDLCLFAATPSFSQLITSFFAFMSLGIHRLPFFAFFSVFFRLSFFVVVVQYVNELCVWRITDSNR